MKKLKDLQNKIGVEFENILLLEEAVTHRSYLNENRTLQHGHNERLEFLGDAVLELATTEELYHRFPNDPEGELTIYRAALVNTKALAEVAEKLGLDEEVLLSRGEARDFNGRGRESISANAVEAVIGAIYLDQGYKTAKRFVNKFVMARLESVTRAGGKDAKSLVQEMAQERFKITPTYNVLDETGPAHDRTFKVGLYFNGDLKSKGKGNSKQDAETDAAQNFLDSL